MFETATTRETRRAYRAAHEARGAALRDALSWVFGR